MAPPIVDLNDVTVLVNGRISVSDLFTAFDPDDLIVSYTISDFQDGAGTGHYEKDGVAFDNGSTFTFDASELSKIEYVGGTDVRFEGFKVVARDQVGDFSSPAVRGRIYSVRENTTQPHVVAPTFTLLANEELKGSTFISGYDPDGYPLTHFRITEGTKLNRVSSSGGFVNIAGFQHRFSSGDVVTLSGANEAAYNITGVIEVLSQHDFRISSPGISDGNATGAMFGYSDDGSEFRLDGAPIPGGTPFTITADQIDDLTYAATGASDSENFYIQGYDGAQWSFDKKGFAGTRINANAPVVQLTRTSTPADQRLSMAGAFEVVDADESTMKKYRFFNTSPHGEKGDLYRGAALMPRRVWFEVTAAQLPSVTFETSIPFDEQQIRIMAYDGHRWSAPGTLVVASLAPIVRADIEVDSTVSLIRPIEQRTFLDVASVFKRVDQGDEYELVEIYESNVDPKSGNFRDGDTPLQGGQIHQFTESQFQSRINFYSGEFFSRQLDTVYARKANGNGLFSEWEKFEIRTEPEFEDVLRSGSTWVGLLPRNAEGKIEISYSYMQQFPSYGTGEAVDNNFPEHFSIFTDVQRENSRMVFRHLEEIANVQFVEVSDTSTNIFGGTGGIVRMGEYGLDNSNAAAFAFYPGFGDSPGDLWFNRLKIGSQANLDFQKGSRGFRTFMHELGHAMGLKHPHDGSPRLPPETDVNDFSVMSYNNRPDGFPTTYQQYDQTELQRLYGANTDTRTGNDVYSIWAFWEGDTEFIETIWDAGGNDTLSGVGSVNGAVIDLRPGLTSSIGSLPANVNLTYGVEIENGIGSHGADRIIGNSLDNVLIGLTGDDYLFGNSGTDVLRGGEGDDTYEWGVGDDNDTIDEQGLAGRDTLRMASFPTLDSLKDDLSFYMEGNDLFVNLSLDNGLLDNTLKITNHAFGGSRVETLELDGTKIDFANLTSFLVDGEAPKKFDLLATSSAFGQLVVPV